MARCMRLGDMEIDIVEIEEIDVVTSIEIWQSVH